MSSVKRNSQRSMFELDVLPQVKIEEYIDDPSYVQSAKIHGFIKKKSRKKSKHWLLQCFPFKRRPSTELIENISQESVYDKTSCTSKLLIGGRSYEKLDATDSGVSSVSNRSLEYVAQAHIMGFSESTNNEDRETNDERKNSTFLKRTDSGLSLRATVVDNSSNSAESLLELKYPGTPKIEFNEKQHTATSVHNTHAIVRRQEQHVDTDAKNKTVLNDDSLILTEIDDEINHHDENEASLLCALAKPIEHIPSVRCKSNMVSRFNDDATKQQCYNTDIKTSTASCDGSDKSLTHPSNNATLTLKNKDASAVESFQLRNDNENGNFQTILGKTHLNIAGNNGPVTINIYQQPPKNESAAACERQTSRQDCGPVEASVSSHSQTKSNGIAEIPEEEAGVDNSGKLNKSEFRNSTISEETRDTVSSSDVPLSLENTATILRDIGIFDYGIPAGIEDNIFEIVNGDCSIQATSGNSITVCVQQTETEQNKEALATYLQELKESQGINFGINTNWPGEMRFHEDINYPYYGSPLHLEDKHVAQCRDAMATFGGGVTYLDTNSNIRKWFVVSNFHIFKHLKERYESKHEASAKEGTQKNVKDLQFVTWGSGDCNDDMVLCSYDSPLHELYGNFKVEVPDCESMKLFYMDIALKEINVPVGQENKVIEALCSNDGYRQMCCKKIPNCENNINRREIVRKPSKHFLLRELIGKKVFKFGQGSFRTDGIIIGRVTVRMDKKVYSDILVIKSARKDRIISKPGDSGSVYVTDDGTPIAVHCITVHTYPADPSSGCKYMTVSLAFLLHPALQTLSLMLGHKLEFVNLGMLQKFLNVPELQQTTLAGVKPSGLLKGPAYHETGANVPLRHQRDTPNQTRFLSTGITGRQSEDPTTNGVGLDDTLA